MDRLCGNCNVPVMSDGHGELIHIDEIGEKDYPGSYGCYPLSALPKRNPEKDPRFSLVAK